MRADEQVRHKIQEDATRPGPAEARLRDSGVPVWALVSYYEAAGDIDSVARDFEIPAEDVRAALAYYRSHKLAIDARLAMNAA